MRAATAEIEVNRAGDERITLPVLLGGHAHGRIVPNTVDHYQPLVVPMPLAPPMIWDRPPPTASEPWGRQTMYLMHSVHGPDSVMVFARCATNDSQEAAKLIWREITNKLKGVAWEASRREDL